MSAAPVPSFAAIIPAYAEEQRIAATVTATLGLAGVDLVVVVDDGSADRTAAVAESAGAIVVRHPRNRGKAAALQTGAARIADHERGTGTARHLLLVDADLESTAAALHPLLAPVAEGEADLTIGTLPPQRRPDGSAAGGHGLVVRLSGAGITAATGWRARQPLSGQRALTRDAFAAALPLAAGFGVETGMSIDLLRAQFRILEVEVEVRHRAGGTDLRSQVHRAHQWRDVARALAARGALPAALRASVQRAPALEPGS